MKENLALQTLRKNRGHSAYQVAKDLGMTAEMYRRYERGLTLPNMQNSIKIARYFRTSVETVFGDMLE